MLAEGDSECIPNSPSVNILHIHVGSLATHLGSRPVVPVGEGSDHNQSLFSVDMSKDPPTATQEYRLTICEEKQEILNLLENVVTLKLRLKGANLGESRDRCCTSKGYN